MTYCYSLPVSERPADLVLPKRRTLWYLVAEQQKEHTLKPIATDCVLPLREVNFMPPRIIQKQNIPVLFL